MKKKNRQFLSAIIMLLAVYNLLLVILVEVEKGHPGAQIKSFGDAIWFSLVTLSTVGFGDMTPKTPAGHLIGIIFLVMSMGILIALIGSVMSFLSSEGFPMLRLRFRQRDDWYYFADFSAESDTLARDILKRDEDAVIIYGIRKDEEIEEPDYPCLFVNSTPARIVAQKHGKGNRCKFFFMKENDIGSNMKAIDLHKLPVDVYARTTSGRGKMSGNIHFFHSYDCCARSYWRNNPLSPEENRVVLIGFGHYGEALLERAILTNIVDPYFDVEYHVFGDARRFLEIHRMLGTFIGINEKLEGEDSIYFHEENWTSAHEILKAADRIIICEDDEEQGWDDLWQIQRYYGCTGRIDFRSNREAPGALCFGTNEQIYTVDQIIRTKLNDAAVSLNDLYRQSVEESLDWDELPDLLKQSKIASADHLFMKVRYLLKGQPVVFLNVENCRAAYEAYCRMKQDPEELEDMRRIEHGRWVRFYTYYNWSYGPVRDSVLHQNPMICPYDDLTDDQKAHHDLAWELLREISEQLQKEHHDLKLEHLREISEQLQKKHF